MIQLLVNCDMVMFVSCLGSNSAMGSLEGIRPLVTVEAEWLQREKVMQRTGSPTLPLPGVIAPQPGSMTFSRSCICPLLAPLSSRVALVYNMSSLGLCFLFQFTPLQEVHCWVSVMSTFLCFNFQRCYSRNFQFYCYF